MGETREVQELLREYFIATARVPHPHALARRETHGVSNFPRVYGRMPRVRGFWEEEASGQDLGWPSFSNEIIQILPGESPEYNIHGLPIRDLRHEAYAIRWFLDLMPMPSVIYSLLL